MSQRKSQKRKEVDFKRFIKKSFTFFFQGDWKSLGYYFVAELCNVLNRNNISLSFKKINCSICYYSSSSFLNLSNSFGITWNSACPNCGSRSRHRGLIFLYESIFKNLKGKKILHFAPELLLENKLRGYNQHYYYTTDLNMNNVDFPRVDIQKLSFDILLEVQFLNVYIQFL